MMRVDRFVKRKDAELPRSPNENTGKKLTDDLTRRQLRASELRVNVPVTHLGAKGEANVSTSRQAG
jgi:hypothetical protein